MPKPGVKRNYCARPVENVALTTKGLQERKQLVSGTTVEKLVIKINNSKAYFVNKKLLALKLLAEA